MRQNHHLACIRQAESCRWAGVDDVLLVKVTGEVRADRAA
jgi:hypothetical protein